jgi:hypothetical protein
MKKRKKDTLDDILAIKFAGNYRDDAKSFDRINKYLGQKGEHPLKKFAADLHANINGMGIKTAIPYPGDDYYNDFDYKENAL